MKKVCLVAIMLLVFFAVCSCTRQASVFSDRKIQAELVKYLGFGDGFHIEFTVLLEDSRKFNRLVLYPETLNSETQTYTYSFGSSEGTLTKNLRGYSEAVFPCDGGDYSLHIASGGKKTKIELTPVAEPLDISAALNAFYGHFRTVKDISVPDDAEVTVRFLYDLVLPDVYIYVGAASRLHMYSALLYPGDYRVAVSEILPSRLNTNTVAVA